MADSVSALVEKLAAEGLVGMAPSLRSTVLVGRDARPTRARPPATA